MNRARSSLRTCTGPVVQILERRLLLYAYNLDPTFGDDGIASGAFKKATHFNAALVAEVNPQTVLVVGQADVPVGQRLALPEVLLFVRGEDGQHHRFQACRARFLKFFASAGDEKAKPRSHSGAWHHLKLYHR